MNVGELKAQLESLNNDSPVYYKSLDNVNHQVDGLSPVVWPEYDIPVVILHDSITSDAPKVLPEQR